MAECGSTFGFFYLEGHMPQARAPASSSGNVGKERGALLLGRLGLGLELGLGLDRPPSPSPSPNLLGRGVAGGAHRAQPIRRLAAHVAARGLDYHLVRLRQLLELQPQRTAGVRVEAEDLEVGLVESAQVRQQLDS